MSTPVYKVGDLVSHCDTHGSDRDQSRWRPAMRPCEITSVEGPDKWGSYTYGIRHTDGREGARVAACCWLSPNADTRPPYFSNTIKWPCGGALSLTDGSTLAGDGFFVAFRLDPDAGAYALHSNTAEVTDEVERTFHARRHTLEDLAHELSEIAKLRNIHSLDADDFARLIRGAVAKSRTAEDWVMEWAGVGGVSEGEEAPAPRTWPTEVDHTGAVMFAPVVGNWKSGKKWIDVRAALVSVAGEIGITLGVSYASSPDSGGASEPRIRGGLIHKSIAEADAHIADYGQRIGLSVSPLDHQLLIMFSDTKEIAAALGVPEEDVVKFLSVADKGDDAPAAEEKVVKKVRAPRKTKTAEPAGEPTALPVVATLDEVGTKEHSGIIIVHADEAPVFPVYPTHFRGVLLRPASDWADPSAEGVFVGVSNADYHADKGSLSSTRIKSLVQSEAHALVPVEISQTARDIGTLVHGFALEGFTTAEQMGFKVVEGKTTTKEGCVTTTMIATAQACVKALRDDANTRALIAREGLSELSVRVRCPDTGLMLRARFDRAPAEGFGCFDIKTTGGTIEQFVASFFEFGYDIGAFHYLRVSDLAGLGYRGMSFPVVCKEAPHEVGLFHFANATQVADEWDLAAKSHRAACVREQHIRTTGEARKRTHEPVWPNAKPWQVESRRRRLGDAEIPY